MEGSDGAKHPQEYFLRQILRFGAAAREAIAKRVDLPGMEPDQFLPSGFVAVQASGYEAVVLTRATLYQIPASANFYRRVNSHAAKQASQKSRSRKKRPFCKRLKS